MGRLGRRPPRPTRRLNRRWSRTHLAGTNLTELTAIPEDSCQAAAGLALWASIRGQIVKRRILVSLLALPFCCVGAWMLWSISGTHLHLNDVVRLDNDSTLQTQSGGKHIMHYSIHALDRRGDKIVVGEAFRGVNEAQAAIRFIDRDFGLSRRICAGAN